MSPRLARDCFKWLLCPMQAGPSDTKPGIDVHPIPAGNTPYAVAVESVCRENELIISTWGSVHLRTLLRRFYWSAATPAVPAQKVWEDMQKYLYLPRLRNRAVYEQTLRQAEAHLPATPLLGTATRQRGEDYEGFAIGDQNVKLTDDLLLIEPGVAAHHAEKQAAEAEALRAETAAGSDAPTSERAVTTKTTGAAGKRSPTPSPGSVPPAKLKSFRGSVEVSALAPKMAMVKIAEDLIALLAADPHANVKITLEIEAQIPNGASEKLRRDVSENATSLGFSTKIWE